MIKGMKRCFKAMLAQSHRAPAPGDDALVSAMPKDLIALQQQARSLSLRAVKIISPQSGGYLSPFKGRGMEYQESRPYQPGDDIRNLDWRVTARSGKTYTKQFREERERAVIMWVDFRQPMQFATRGVFKSVLAARAAALLAWSAVQQGDRVGGLIFAEQRHQELRPHNGDRAALRFIRQLCAGVEKDNAGNNYVANDAAAGTRQDGMAGNGSAEEALVRLRRVTRPGSLVILISDFRHLGTHAESHLMQLSRHNDVIMLFIFDPLERELPPAGTYRVSDGVHSQLLDTGDARGRMAYQNKFQQHREYLQSLSRRYGISFISCATDQDIVQVLQQGLRLKRS